MDSNELFQICDGGQADEINQHQNQKLKNLYSHPFHHTSVSLEEFLDL